MRLALACLVLIAAACQCEGRCDATTCSGCCAADGCQPGAFSGACGSAGLDCRVCQTGESCRGGACVAGPAVSFAGGRAGGAGAPAGGSAGGGTSGGVASGGGFATIPGDLNAEIGRICVDTAQCGSSHGVPLACLPAPLIPTSRVCQIECRPDDSCGNDWRCLTTTVGGVSCKECLVPCPTPTGLRSTCAEQERCVVDLITGRGGVCTPDCRLAHAMCGSGVCGPNGLCSDGGLVARCLTF